MFIFYKEDFLIKNFLVRIFFILIISRTEFPVNVAKLPFSWDKHEGKGRLSRYEGREACPSSQEAGLSPDAFESKDANAPPRILRA